MTATTPRPNFEAIDKHGLPYLRKAQLIGELPTNMAYPALQQATEKISDLIGKKPANTICYGSPAYCAFSGMTRNVAKSHQLSKILLSRGESLSLDLCDGFDPE